MTARIQLVIWFLYVEQQFKCKKTWRDIIMNDLLMSGWQVNLHVFGNTAMQKKTLNTYLKRHLDLNHCCAILISRPDWPGAEQTRHQEVGGIDAHHLSSRAGNSINNLQLYNRLPGKKKTNKSRVEIFDNEVLKLRACQYIALISNIWRVMIMFWVAFFLSPRKDTRCNIRGVIADVSWVTVDMISGPGVITDVLGITLDTIAGPGVITDVSLVTLDTNWGSQ